ncbi:hypothetical protein ANN_27643 [Periplaneta americana]|uniref:Uncharacterized protein n=1 Tax=Periplaneta americana TaxID=6978 RepID=A0ABQ8RWF9_PERAM|nr:hypothetical protein ANN_27643 [Periplaneta americana]
MDPSCDLKSEIKMEETEEPVTFLVMKCESEVSDVHWWFSSKGWWCTACALLPTP